MGPEVDIQKLHDRINHLEAEDDRWALRVAELEEAVAAFAGSDEASKVESLVAERTRSFMVSMLQADDQGRTVSICTWCGKPSDRASDEFKSHMLTCAQSPLVARVRELEAETDRLNSIIHRWEEVAPMTGRRLQPAQERVRELEAELLEWQNFATEASDKKNEADYHD